MRCVEPPLLVGEEDGDLLAEERLAQAIRGDPEQGLAVGVREKSLRELRQGDEVAPLGLEELEPRSRERREAADEKGRDEEDEERRDVARVRRS